ncbi:Peroxisomal membrane protein 11B [Oopsacas minuta]|uniref:Peroxisomal membrane protein 11B n=1 Tax=Oopsacas minuta TaxID=111878 RepID=A0AAV7JUN8_9METZ|nr:Peroxisomal membrane protein 11B [Oopsacas minuta]
MDTGNRGVVQTIVNVLQRTSGRDKIARIIQYGGLFIAWLIDKYNLPQHFVKKIIRVMIRRESLSNAVRAMSSSAGNARKVFRLFGYIEQLRSAVSALSLIDPNKMLLVSSAKLCAAGYLFCDNLVWVNSVNIISLNADKWKKYEYRFWLTQIALNSLRDFYEWCLIGIREIERINSARTGEVIPLEPKPIHTRLLSICSLNKDLIMDSITNIMDLTIPLTKLGYTHIPEHMIGLIGLITSILRLIPIISPIYKLPYS